MCPANTEASVAHGDDDVQVGPGQFQSGCVGQGPAMQAVKGVGLEKSIEKTRATDVRHNDDFVFF